MPGAAVVVAAVHGAAVFAGSHAAYSPDLPATFSPLVEFHLPSSASQYAAVAQSLLVAFLVSAAVAAVAAAENGPVSEAAVAGGDQS